MKGPNSPQIVKMHGLNSDDPNPCRNSSDQNYHCDCDLMIEPNAQIISKKLRISKLQELLLNCPHIFVILKNKHKRLL
jgi:hypothetical protein